MIAFHDFVDQSRHTQATIHIVLLVLGSEHLIEIVDLATIHLRFMNVLAVVLGGLQNLDLIVAADY